MEDNKTFTIDVGLSLMKEDEKLLMRKGADMVSSYGGTIYPMDLFAAGALNRAFNLSQGFRALVAQRNIYCIGAILRLHLDTAIRFYAGFLVSDPHDFATKVHSGKHIRNFTDRNGHRLTDHYLVTQLSEEFPGIKEHYQNTSGYVHMSEVHTRSIMKLGSVSDSFQLSIGDRGKEVPDSAFCTAIQSFRTSTEILLLYIVGWIFTKNNPEKVAEMKKDRDSKQN